MQRRPGTRAAVRVVEQRPVGLYDDLFSFAPHHDVVESARRQALEVMDEPFEYRRARLAARA